MNKQSRRATVEDYVDSGDESYADSDGVNMPVDGFNDEEDYVVSCTPEGAYTEFSFREM